MGIENHTPLPWIQQSTRPYLVIAVKNAAENVADCWMSEDYETGEEKEEDYYRAEANAALIVKAVNEYDDLIIQNAAYSATMAKTADKIEALLKTKAELVEALKDVQKDLKFHGMENFLVDAALVNVGAK